MAETLDSFKTKFPRVWDAYENLREIGDREGPLDKKTVELVKVGISAALGREGGLIAHISRATKAGAAKNEIYHAILLAISLAGFPTTLAAFGIAKKHLEG